MRTTEQVGRARRYVKIGPKEMRFLKAQTSRLRRREGKRDPENAATKGYRGWRD